jgi:hypothetical protein
MALTFSDFIANGELTVELFPNVADLEAQVTTWISAAPGDTDELVKKWVYSTAYRQALNYWLLQANDIEFATAKSRFDRSALLDFIRQRLNVWEGNTNLLVATSANVESVVIW